MSTSSMTNTHAEGTLARTAREAQASHARAAYLTRLSADIRDGYSRLDELGPDAIFMELTQDCVCAEVEPLVSLARPKGAERTFRNDAR